MKKYDAIIIGFGKAGKTLAAELGNVQRNLYQYRLYPDEKAGAYVESHFLPQTFFLRTVCRRVPPGDCREKGTDFAAA